MARAAFGATLGQSVGSGRFNTVSGSVTPVSTAIVAVQALEAAVTSAIAAAVANGTIAGDPTALGLVNAIGTAFTALDVALTTAAAAGTGKNVILDIDLAVCTTRSAVREVMESIMRSLDGSGLAP